MWRKFHGLLALAMPEHTTPPNFTTKPQNLRKFFPSKVSRYTLRANSGDGLSAEFSVFVTKQSSPSVTARTSYTCITITEVKPLKGHVDLMPFSWACQVLFSPAPSSLCPSPQSGLHCASEAQQPGYRFIRGTYF